VHDPDTRLAAQANRSSGLELEAVVEATETAVNQIMAAAEGIGDWVRGGRGRLGGAGEQANHARARGDQADGNHAPLNRLPQALGRFAARAPREREEMAAPRRYPLALPGQVHYVCAAQICEPHEHP